MVLELLEDRLDPVPLRAIRGQVVEEDPRLRQPRPGGLHDLADVKATVIPNPHPGHLGRGPAIPQVSPQILGGDRPLEGHRVQARDRFERLVGGQGVDPPPLGGLVLDPLALPRQAPGVARRQGRAEAPLVQVEPPQSAGLDFFFKSSTTRSARSTFAGSCW
jgi:hypothetical protein